MRKIQSYIAKELKNPSAAQRILTSLLKNAHLLVSQPYLGVDLQKKSDVRPIIAVSSAETIAYHYDGELIGDYDKCSNEEEIFRLLKIGKADS